AKAEGCIWHTSSPSERSLFALKGSIASRMKRSLPASSTPEPPFDTVENIITWSQKMARSALVDDVDPRRLAEARGYAQLALSALNARTQQQLIEALLSLERGGAAVALLASFTNGSAKRTPIPGRPVVSLPAVVESPSS